MKKIQIFEQPLDGKKGKIAILRGGLNVPNPKEFMDEAVRNYVKGELHNQFVEIHLDNPWVRVVVMGINDLTYKEV